MKTKLLLVSVLCSALSITAQKIENVSNTVGKNKATVSKRSTAINTQRDAFYTNDFSNASDWVISAQAGNDNWVIGTNVPSGAYAIDGIASTTAANGFALFDSDLLCGGNQVANLTLANGIDCSAQAEVLLSFEQQYRRFFDSTFVFVSNDDGANWVKYTVNGDLANNDFCDGNPNLAQVYISPTAANQANVKIRFQFYSPSSLNALAGCGYSWMIDDVALSTPLQSNVTINQVYAANIFADYDMGLIALSQADTVQSTVVVANNGSLPQNVVLNYSIKRNGTEVNSGSMPAAPVAPFSVANLAVISGYVPDQIGNYTIDVNATIGGTDEDPSDNAGSNGFEITENIFASVGDLAATVALDLNVPTTAPFDIYRAGQTFLIRNPIALNSIEISPARVGGNAATGDISLDIELFDAADLNTQLAVESFVVSSTHPTTPAWYNVALSSPFDLSAGQYLISMGNFDDTKIFTFNAGEGDDDVGTLCYGPFGANDAVDWYIGWDFSPAIGMNFGASSSINEVSAADQLVVSPNPANEQLSINLTLARPSSMTISMIDINGKVVFNRTVEANLIGYKDVLPLTDFANGVYTVNVTSSNGSSSQKVVIAH
jgi:hypothetical protein